MDDKKDSKKTEKPEAAPTSTNTSMIIGVVIAALVAFPIGYVLGSSGDNDSASNMTAETDDSHSHADDKSSGSHSHAHEMHEVPEGVDAPVISMIEVTEDAKSGWNLNFMTENFDFSPENASQDHVEGEGHAHLYIDGEKITRLYSGNYYIGELSEGEHEIMVTLNTNDHNDYAVDGEVIAASTTVTDMHHSGDEDSHSEHSDDTEHMDDESHSEEDGHDHSHDN